MVYPASRVCSCSAQVHLRTFDYCWQKMAFFLLLVSSGIQADPVKTAHTLGVVFLNGSSLCSFHFVCQPQGFKKRFSPSTKSLTTFWFTRATWWPIRPVILKWLKSVWKWTKMALSSNQTAQAEHAQPTQLQPERGLPPCRSLAEQLILANPHAGEPNWLIFMHLWLTCCSLHCLLYFQTCQQASEKVAHMSKRLSQLQEGANRRRIWKSSKNVEGSHSDLGEWVRKPGTSHFLEFSSSKAKVKHRIISF